ncbi:MAG: class I SAM-dependent methyltransferase [Alphaproteobacteria bacterium]|nr:MAG: class I SAM-dependent methyltransferase [Alphaproteobacteria bacterium]
MNKDNQRQNANAYYDEGELGALTYDLFYEGNTRWEDIGFYRQLAVECGSPVLEIGAGTGRVTWVLAEEGTEMVGLDLSINMLAVAESRRSQHPPDVASRVEFIEADMTDFDLGRQFPLIIVPACAFQHLVTPEEQFAALTCFRRHLVPGGKLVLHLFDPKLEMCIPDGPRSERIEEATDPQTGHLIRRSIIGRELDPMRQRFEEKIRIEVFDDTGKIVQTEETSWALRWTLRQEMRYLLERTGFEVEAEYSDFSYSPPAYGKKQVWVAVAAD